MKIIISIAATAELIYNGASGYLIGSGSPDPPLYFSSPYVMLLHLPEFLPFPVF